MVHSVRTFLAISLVLLTAACSAGRSPNTGATQASPTAFDPLDHLISLTAAQSQVSFQLVVPKSLPANLTFAGVIVQLNQPPGGIPGTRVTPVPWPHQATLMYRLTTTQKDSLHPQYISLNEADVSLPDVGTEFQANGGTTAQDSPAAGLASPIVSREILTVQGIKIAKTVMTVNNQRQVDSYYWQHAGLTFDLQFYVIDGADQMATMIVTGTLI